MTDENGQEYYREGIPIPETPDPGEDPAPWKRRRWWESRFRAWTATSG